MLCSIDEFTREALAILVKHRFNGMNAPGGYCMRFNSKLRDELLDREFFYRFVDARPVAGGQMH